MEIHNLIIQGAGRHAGVVIDCAIEQGYTVACAYDPKGGGTLYGVPVRNEYLPEDYPDARAVVAIGDNATRKKLAEGMRHSFANVIHRSAMLSPFSNLGVGNVILHGVIIQVEAKIGHHVIINTGSQVDHDCVVEDFVHLAPGVVLCGSVQVGEGSFLGAGTTVIPGKKIGAWCIIGAGSVVIDDIPDFVVAVGNPARVIKHWKP